MQAKRNNLGKPQLHYLLVFQNALTELAQVCEHGAQEYGDYNFLLGAPESQHAGSALRHLFARWRGEKVDPKSGRSHLIHAAWNLLRWAEEEISQPEGYQEDSDSYAERVGTTSTILPPPPENVQSEFPTAPPPLGKRYELPERPELAPLRWRTGSEWSELTPNGWSIKADDLSKQVYLIPEGRYAGMYAREDGTVHPTMYYATRHTAP